MTSSEGDSLDLILVDQEDQVALSRFIQADNGDFIITGIALMNNWEQIYIGRFTSDLEEIWSREYEMGRYWSYCIISFRVEKGILSDLVCPNELGRIIRCFLK